MVNRYPPSTCPHNLPEGTLRQECGPLPAQYVKATYEPRRAGTPERSPSPLTNSRGCHRATPGGKSNATPSGALRTPSIHRLIPLSKQWPLDPGRSGPGERLSPRGKFVESNLSGIDLDRVGVDGPVIPVPSLIAWPVVQRGDREYPGSVTPVKRRVHIRPFVTHWN